MSGVMIRSLIILFVGLGILVAAAIVYFKWEDGQDRWPYVTIVMFLVGAITAGVGGMTIIGELI